MDSDAPILNLIGEKVALGPIRRDQIPLFARWINDFAVSSNLKRLPRPMTLEAEQAWYDQAAAVKDTDVVFTIYEKSTLRPIGSCGLHAVNHPNRTAEFGIMIGEREFWGRGYGAEATRLMMDYAFTALNLHNLMLRVYSFNERGIRAYEKAGFKEFGRRRQAIRNLGRVADEVYMDCLATEFEGTAVKQAAGVDARRPA